MWIFIENYGTYLVFPVLSASFNHIFGYLFPNRYSDRPRMLQHYDNTVILFEGECQSVHVLTQIQMRYPTSTIIMARIRSFASLERFKYDRIIIYWTARPIMFCTNYDSGRTSLFSSSTGNSRSKKDGRTTSSRSPGGLLGDSIKHKWRIRQRRKSN